MRHIQQILSNNGIGYACLKVLNNGSLMKFIFIAATLFIFSNLSAQETEMTVVKIYGKQFEVDVLPEIRSQSGDINAFAKIVGVQLRNYTRETGFEACAMICRGKSGWGVAPISVKSQLSCALTTLCPEGTTPVNQGIHSHPKVIHFKLNNIDRFILSPSDQKGIINLEIAARKTITSVKTFKNNPNSSNFSDMDFQMPGYMVDDENIYYQSSHKNIKNLGSLD